jgi:hypothetical protein
MRATFYEALEVPATAETSTIKSALRAVLRRFWSVPRDPSGDTEEAVRFVALGAGMLTQVERREQYDTQARRGVSTNPWRTGGDGASGDSNLLVAGSNNGSAQLPTATADAQRAIPTVHALTDPLPELDYWSSGIAYALSAVVLAAAAIFAYFATRQMLGNNGSMLVMLAVLALGLTLAAQTKVISSELSGFSLARLAITKWRRETSVFVGNPPPQQDTAWIFRLRVMELTRSAAGYSSALHIGVRALARAADYALIAFAIVFVSVLIDWTMPTLAAATALLRSPLVLPALIVLLAIPLESVLIARWRTTPGKFLMGVVVSCAVTQPDDQPEPSVARLSTARSVAFARNAMYFGLWPLALLRAREHLRVLRANEGSWEASGDSVSLVRAAPLLMRSSAVSAVVAAALGFAFLWTSDVQRAFSSLSKTATEVALPSIKNAAQQVSDAVKSTAESLPGTPAPPVTEPKAGGETSGASPTTSTTTSVASTAQTPSVAASTTPAEPNKAAPTTTPQTTREAPNVPNKTSGSATGAPSDFEKQATIVQQRRARIEAAERGAASARTSGNYAGLQGLCERWTQDQPGSAEAWRCLGLAQFQSGAGRGALPALRQALKLEPNDSEVESAIFRILRPAAN